MKNNLLKKELKEILKNLDKWTSIRKADLKHEKKQFSTRIGKKGDREVYLLDPELSVC